MSKFLKVEVTRHQWTEVYLEVPDDFDSQKLVYIGAEKILKPAIRATVKPFDWETDAEEDMEYEGQSVEEVSESEARDYLVFKVEER